MRTSPERAKRWTRALLRQDRGAVIVEAAFVVPVLLLMVFGIMETGRALKSYSTASNGVRAGGRMASVAGNDAMADAIILQRISNETAALPDAEIEYIVLWHSSGPGSSPGAGTPPANCRPATQTVPNTSSAGTRVTGGGVGACSVYFRPADPGGAFDMAAGEAAHPVEYYFGCTNPATEANQKLDCNWMPGERKVTKSPRSSGTFTSPDYLGVYIRVTHTTVTGIIGRTFTITDESVYLLEPQGYGIT